MKIFPVKNFIFKTGTKEQGFQTLRVKNFFVYVHKEIIANDVEAL